MNRRRFPFRLPAASACRLALTLGLALAGAAPQTAMAQTGPLATSPPVPAPYDSHFSHAGGAVTPGVAPYTAQAGQLQGTPTGLYPLVGGVPTQIPSFLLGDYNYLFPPAAASVYFPEHFADGDVYSWAAPFAYVPTSASTVTVDDSQTVAAANGVFLATGGFTNVSGVTGSGDIPAGTATNGEYDRLPAGTQATPVNGTATWTLVAAAPGSFSVYFHIPDDTADSLGNVEPRSTAVEYAIKTTGAFAQAVTATVSQTEANSLQYLVGPFQLAVGDTVTVTLTRDATQTGRILKTLNQNNVTSTLVADSMTLQNAIGDVRCTPTALNYESDPIGFATLSYWGIYVPTGVTVGTTQTAGTTAAQNAIPDTTGGTVPNTTAILHYGNPAKATTPTRRIRQLVYFGRSEPTINSTVRVDDLDTLTNFTPAPLASWTTTPSTTATNAEYLRTTATNIPASATAQWKLTAPNGGSYFLSVHLPGVTAAAETRITDATYHVSVTHAGVTTALPDVTGFTQVPQGGGAADVSLPTGVIPLAKNDVVTVTLDNTTGNTIVATGAITDVVADSITLTDGNGQGAIYCADGFNGEVVWRFATPASPRNGPSAPVYSSPAIARINVLVTPAGPGGTPAAVYANKMVVIVGDDNGMVYCLDAYGNADGTSNANVLDATGQPIYVPQPAYGSTPPAFDSTNPHVGTTSVYWVYRPDPTLPKTVGTGAVKATPDPNSDLPVPGAFGSASPVIFVDPSKTTIPVTVADSNALVYVGNRNGVLYALNPIGVAIDGTSQATYRATGDTLFNVSLDLRARPAVFPATAADPVVPTCQPQWWFNLRGANPNSAVATSSADIESAPALYVTATLAAAPALGTVYIPTVYVGSAHEQEGTSNVGRLYALNGLTGPSGNGGKSLPLTQPNPAAAGYTGPGSLDYNIAQIPQISKTDTADWSFPSALDSRDPGTTQGWVNKSKDGTVRPALGSVSGSPVVFTNLHETTDTTQKTRIYFAANTGLEVPANSPNATTAPTVRPDDTQTGRIWAVNLDGSVGTTTNSGAINSTTNANVWAYPAANNPNDVGFDKISEPSAPIGAFLHMTPAIGYVQFPTTITTGNTIVYAPKDQVATGVNGIKGQVVPMLYAATRGVNDTALYGVDIDGAFTVTKTTTAGVITITPADQRTVYRQISPGGAIFQSSPILITNATSTGGNGGSLLIVGGNTLYDFSATPISNPITGQGYPLIRENRAFVGFGPLSAPAVAATNVNDLTFVGAAPTNVVTDWVYVGDSSTGLCRGITPNDITDSGIPTDLGDIVPPNEAPVPPVDLISILRTYLVNEPNSGSTKYADRLTIGGTLPVYEWGQNVYIRIANVVPPNPINTATGLDDPKLYVHDDTLALADFITASPLAPINFYTNPGTAYTNAVTYTLSDATPNGNIDSGPVSVDSGSIPATAPVARAPLENGFYSRPTSDASADQSGENNLIDGNGSKWIAAATYFIGDGSARKNTPGARRRVQEATQTVTIRVFYNTLHNGDITDLRNFTPLAIVGPTALAGSTTVLRGTATNGNEVSVPVRDATGAIKSYKFQVVKPSDQPTFGILNPIAMRGGGVPLPLLNGTASNAAVDIGNDLGPFRGATSPPYKDSTGALQGGDNFALQALTNGNSVYEFAPPSTSGSGNPTILPLVGDANDPNMVPQTVVTSTGLIPNNSGGDNRDNSPNAPPTGSHIGSNVADSGNGLSAPNFGSPDRPYALDVFDRSALAVGASSTGSTAVARSIKLKAGGASDTGGTSGTGGPGMSWNDNTLGLSTGHDAVVNYLPWETPPTSYKNGVNTSSDYPDIGPQNVSMTLHADDNAGGSTASLNSDGAVPTPVTPGADLLHRVVHATPVQVHVNVPRYQPANQQLYSQTLGGSGGYSSAGEIVPQGIGSAGDIVFPMGYVTTQRIYVPNASGRYQPGCAYRDVRIYTGVPVSMSTSIADGTIDIGKVPSAFGIQTSQYAGLGPFAPYNANYYNYFLPVTVHNDGNVNLLNVHLDQKVVVNGVLQALQMQSDPVDPLSDIPAYDFNFVTGPRTATFGSVPELPFLIRSSVDTDLAAAYGRNPGIVADTTLNAEYLGTTFHKALPGSAIPTTLRVPDAPDSPSNLTFVVPPTTDANGKPQTVHQALPHISVAVPFGTPVGAYRQNVRAFEGLDTQGYSTYAGTTGPNPYYPPQYGGAIGGRQAPNTRLMDSLTLGVQPMSDPGVTVRATVLEDRLTDGDTFGGLPQIDSGPAIPAVGTTPTQSTPDFAPAAFRDPTSGGIGIYWTSGRPVSGSTSQYNIQGAYVPYNLNSATLPGNYFLPGNVSGTSALGWWNPFTPTLITGTNSGLTIAQDLSDPTNVFAFVVNVTTLPYVNTLYCYPMTPGTGALGTGQVVSADPAQVKYGIHGLYTKSGFAGTVPNLWAFWTTTTRGRTAIAYNSRVFGTGNWPLTTGLLTVPAGLSSVADPSPLLVTAPVITSNGGLATSTPFAQSVIEVTFSGVAPDGNTNLYQCRYAPDTTTPSKLNLVSYPTVTENLASADGGWYQARDVAWSRTGQLNLTLTSAAGVATPILYDATLKPLFTKAVFDKASGLLVLTGVRLTGASGGTVTVYADLATGRIRFSAPLPAKTTPSATFNPLARRLTMDNRADMAPVTFLDPFLKPNEAGFYNAINAAKIPAIPGVAAVEADRRWYVWRKSGVTGDAHSATIFYKTQRLTLFLPTPVALDANNQPIITVDFGGTHLYSTAAAAQVDVDYTRGRIYFPISTGTEGQAVTVTYTDPSGVSHTGVSDVVQWQDEQRANDTSNSPTTTLAGLASVYDYAVPLDSPVNENNVSAFLDPYAGSAYEHKVWLFWNSTRNGTADLYEETINPKF